MDLKADIRIVSATNRDPLQAVRDKLLREDLYYRLNVVPIVLPPLRERDGDVSLLAHHFLTKFAQENGKTINALNDAAMEKLLRYPWPGNVRELENAIEQALVFAEGNVITAAALPVHIRGEEPRSGPPDASVLPLPSGQLPLPEILDDLERQLILKAYREAKGVKTETARLLGIKPSALYYKLDKYRIE